MLLFCTKSTYQPNLNTDLDNFYLFLQTYQTYHDLHKTLFLIHPKLCQSGLHDGILDSAED